MNGYPEAGSNMAQRIRRGAQRHGPAGLAHRAYRRARTALAGDPNIVFVHGGRPRGVALPDTVSVTKYRSLADVPADLLGELVAEEGPRQLSRIVGEFQRGGVLWMAVEDGRLAASQWSIPGSRLGLWFIELAPDDIVIFAGMTMPASRSHGLASGLSCWIAEHETDGRSRVFVDCKVWNTQSRRYAERAGFVELSVKVPPVPGAARRLPTPAPNSTLTRLGTDAWNRAVPSFVDGDYRQSWGWGECSADRVGARSEHQGLIAANGDPIALVDVWVKQPMGLAGIAYVNAGPLVRQRTDGDDAGPARDRLAAVLRALVAEYVIDRHLVLRVVPSPTDPHWSAAQAHVFAVSGFAPTERAPARRTILVDLDTAPERLRASFAQKWRNCLNRSEREGLSIRAGRTGELLDEFLPLFDELVERKGFEPGLPARFFAHVQHRLPEQERFHVALAEADGAVVAGQVTAVVGNTAVFVLGASNEEGRKRKAAYALQWEAIAAAQRAGCTSYDLGGIDPVQNPDGYRFKRGLGGIEVVGAGPYEMRPAGLVGRISLAAESAYRLACDLVPTRP